MAADVFQEASRLGLLGERAALATVVATAGSVPRHAGAKMLVRAVANRLAARRTRRRPTKRSGSGHDAAAHLFDLHLQLPTSTGLKALT